MSARGPEPGLALGSPSAWLVLALASVFVLLGLLFLIAPRFGAALFGLPAPEGSAFGYLPAIGLRDLAFGCYLAALARTAPPAALALVLGITVLIPVGDLFVVAFARGLDSPWHLLLHAASALTLAGAAAWVSRQTPRHARENAP